MKASYSSITKTVLASFKTQSTTTITPIKNNGTANSNRSQSTINSSITNNSSKHSNNTKSSSMVGSLKNGGSSSSSRVRGLKRRLNNENQKGNKFYFLTLILSNELTL